MNQNKKFVTLLTWGLIALLLIGEVLSHDQGFSEMENRYLAVRPQASWQNIRTGVWMEDMESYMADHIPLRSTWIQLKNSLERLTGRDQLDSIYFAEDNRLIEVKDISFAQLEKNLQSLGSWIEKLPADIKVDFLAAPNASWVYQEELAPYTLTYDPKQAEAILERLLPERVRLTCAYEALAAHKEEAIYFKSDHHWTMRGAAYAYQALADAMGISVDDSLARESSRMSTNFKGSLYSQAPVFGYPAEEFWVIDSAGLEAKWKAENQEGTVLMQEAFEKKDQYTAFMGGNYGLTRVSNHQASHTEPVLLLKDSYANCMLPFLAETYQEIVMVDLRYYRESLDELMQQEQIKQVICLYNMDFLCTDQNFVWLEARP